MHSLYPTACGLSTTTTVLKSILLAILVWLNKSSLDSMLYEKNEQSSCIFSYEVPLHSKMRIAVSEVADTRMMFSHSSAYKGGFSVLKLRIRYVPTSIILMRSQLAWETILVTKVWCEILTYMDCSVVDDLRPKFKPLKWTTFVIFSDSGFVVEVDGEDVILIIYNF